MLDRLAAAALAACVAAAGIIAATEAEARITRIEITKTEPAFGGQVFGAAGAFERLVGRAYGEVDPAASANAEIQDIRLAPKNAHGMVDYATDIEIVRPADPAQANGVLLFNILNRGNKGLFNPFNADVPTTAAEINRLSSPGDGWLQRQGYTLIYFGWQADVLPGDGRMTFKVPVARNEDGSPITGKVRAEFVPTAPTTSYNLSSGWFTGMTHASYPTVNTDNRVSLGAGSLPTLTVRSRESAPREPISHTQWSFASCPNGTKPTPSETQICMPTGFQPGKLYELIYLARDPLVLGLGFAVARDLGAFLKTAAKDDAGSVNPVVHGGAVKSLVMGTSQSGRMIRTFLLLGFNKSEDGKQVFDAALPHIGGGLLPLNLRFAQPGRAWGEEIDHLYPAYDFPFTYGSEKDPITGRTQGILDRCAATRTCPLIIHAATALEIFEARQSLGLTDPLGVQDVAQPPNVRVYIMASTQHAPPPLPLPAKAPFGVCKQQQKSEPAHLDDARASHRARRLGEGGPRTAAVDDAAHRRCDPGGAGRGALPDDPGDELRRGRTSGDTLSRRRRPPAPARFWPRLPGRRDIGRDWRRAAEHRLGELQHPGAAGGCRRHRSRRHPRRLSAGADRNLYGLEPVPRRPIRGRFLHLLGQLRALRPDQGRTRSGRRSAPFDRGALCDQGRLCGGGSQGEPSPGLAALPARAGRRSPDRRGGEGRRAQRTVMRSFVGWVE